MIWATWPNNTLTHASRVRLDRLGHMLPAIPRVGLELRLGAVPAEESARVDLHQWVRAEQREAALFVKQIEESPLLPHGDTRDRLLCWLSDWSAEASSLPASFRKLFLEYDLDPKRADPVLSGIFLDLHPRAESDHGGRARAALILATVEQLHNGITASRRTALERCLAAVEGRGSIGHLGFMLFREEQPIRLNIKDVSAGTLQSVLEAAGWTGNMSAAAQLFDSLVDEVDRVSVALDLVDDWQPTIGFECFIRSQADAGPRWRRFLHRLLGEGLCSDHECQALLGFPGVTRAGLTSPRWPAPWVVAAARTPPDHRPAFHRELSHVKLTLKPEQAPQAKAYLATYHSWSGATPEPRRQTETRLRNIGDTLSARLTAAIDAAEDFLRAGLAQGGCWRDFHLVNGHSDEWVTAFVASQWALTETPQAMAYAHRALAWLLRRQRADGGWGYNAVSPPDADSTAWVLRLAAICKLRTTAIERAEAFLASHQRPDGRVVTYGPTTPIRLDDRELSDDAAAGWRGAHRCVAANAAPLLGPAALDALRQDQSSEGNWRAYWWRTDLFATALAADSLLTSPTPRNLSAVSRAIQWAREHKTAEASAFDSAWHLRLLGLAPTDAVLADLGPLIQRLLDLQHGDGAWPASAAMLFPKPDEADRPHDQAGRLRLCLDHERHFTTASALGTLALLRRRMFGHAASRANEMSEIE